MKSRQKGRLRVDFIEERSWIILNGSIMKNEEGEYIFTGGVRCTVINYVVMKEETKEWVKKIRMGDKIDSDHQPVEVTMRKRGRDREKQGRKERPWKGIWDKEGREKFRKKLEAEKRCEEKMETGRREMEKRDGGENKESNKGDREGKWEYKQQKARIVRRRVREDQEKSTKRTEKMEKGKKEWGGI